MAAMGCHHTKLVSWERARRFIAVEGGSGESSKSSNSVDVMGRLIVEVKPYESLSQEAF
jgi:hypothetical protein